MRGCVRRDDWRGLPGEKDGNQRARCRDVVRLFIVALAAADLDVESIGDPEREVGENGIFRIGLVDSLQLRLPGASEGHRVDKDKAAERSGALVRVKETEEPVEPRPERRGKAQLLREFPGDVVLDPGIAADTVNLFCQATEQGTDIERVRDVAVTVSGDGRELGGADLPCQSRAV